MLKLQSLREARKAVEFEHQRAAGNVRGGAEGFGRRVEGAECVEDAEGPEYVEDADDVECAEGV